MSRLLVCCLALLAVAGCGAIRAGVSGAKTELAGMDQTVHQLGSPMSTVHTFIALDAISVINTQKTIDDHVISLVSGDDCSTVRASTGGPYCVEQPKPVPTVRRTTYCYKSLAKVTCYDRPLASDAARLVGTRTENVPTDQ